MGGKSFIQPCAFCSVAIILKRKPSKVGQLKLELFKELKLVFSSQPDKLLQRSNYQNIGAAANINCSRCATRRADEKN